MPAIISVIGLFVGLLANLVSVRCHADQWPQFRGVRASGLASAQNLPDSWDVETGEHIAWKTSIPGLGHACPIVSGGRVFVVTAVGAQKDPMLRLGLYGNILSVADEGEHEWILICLSQSTGEIVWQRVLHRGVPAIKRHTKATHANCTPTTDGKRVVVCLGSEGLYCLDFAGELLWKKELGVLDSGYYMAPAAQWEFASSPIIEDQIVYLQCDVQKNSYLAAFDLTSGEEVWRTSREDVPTWSTPTIVDSEGTKQLVVNGYRHAGGYDPSTGQSLWKLGSGGDIPVPTPIFSHGLIFLSSAHGGQRPLRAIRPEALGDITPTPEEDLNDSIAWSLSKSGIYMQTPLVYDGLLYACRNNGLLTCYQADTGERLYRKRLGSGKSGFTASPVAADEKLYFTSEDGEVHIIEHGPEFNQLATNQMDEPCMATPAIADGLLLVRTTKQLIAIGTAPPEPTLETAPQIATADSPAVKSTPMNLGSARPLCVRSSKIHIPKQCLPKHCLLKQCQKKSPRRCRLLRRQVCK